MLILPDFDKFFTSLFSFLLLVFISFFSSLFFTIFISDFDLGYYNNAKLNPSNKVYEKTVPRFVIETSKHYSSNVSVYTFDSPEYMLFNLSINIFMFK